MSYIFDSANISMDPKLQADSNLVHFRAIAAWRNNLLKVNMLPSN